MPDRALKGLLLAAALLAWAGAVRAAVEAPDLGILEQETRIKADSEQKIQRDILDPILGKGRATVFAEVQLEVSAEQQAETKVQAGAAERYKAAGGDAGGSGGLDSQYLLPGIPKPVNLNAPEAAKGRPEQAQQQGAEQQKRTNSVRYSLKTVVKNCRVTVLHDETLAKPLLDLVRERIVDAMAQYQLKPDDVVLRPTKLNTTDPWLEFKKPAALVPMVFAALLALLLLYLFGPVTFFLSRYADLIKRRQSAEITMQTESTGGPEGGKAGDKAALGEAEDLKGSFEHWQRELEAAEEEMKKFEPFVYVNEENLKRLAYLLRREEPWLIAVVLTYLKPEFAREVLSSLPRELQTAVGLETATIRQVSREQIAAIDADIKEKVDFVLGGVEHLVRVLEDADEETRKNIMDYLKAERPQIHEKVREHILMFEDVIRFQDREVQLIVRELKTESMARALQGAEPELMKKFLSNMSAGAASLLREAMEYEKALTPAQIQEERRRILETIKAMDAASKIAVRRRGGSRALEGLEEEEAAARERAQRWHMAPKAPAPSPYPMASAVQPPPAPPAPAAAPAQAPVAAAAKAVAVEEKPKEVPGPFLDAGAALYEEGRFEESLSYFEYALTLDPQLAEARQYLALAYHGLGRKAEALEQFEALWELSPEPAVREWIDTLRAEL